MWGSLRLAPNRGGEREREREEREREREKRERERERGGGGGEEKKGERKPHILTSASCGEKSSGE